MDVNDSPTLQTGVGGTGELRLAQVDVVGCRRAGGMGTHTYLADRSRWYW